MTIREALQHGNSVLQQRADIAEWASRDSNLLLQHAMNARREDLMAWPERTLPEEQRIAFEALLAERLRAVPIQYLRGVQEFYGREFLVTTDVLIPRPETELLIDEVKKKIEAATSARILDVGTGSGAIAVTLAAELPAAHITAVDISPAALAVARKNAEKHGVADRIRFLESDLLAGVRGEIFDCIVSNPPYIGEEERSTLHAQVREHEPSLALFDGLDGFEIYRRLIPQAWQHLRPGGFLFLEIGARGRALDLLLGTWEEVSYVEDLQSLPRTAIARKP
jgi:release factor glutamine methyltransferase